MQEVRTDNLNTQDRYIPRLLKLYREVVIPKMKEKFGYTNNLAVPRLLKIVINMGVGEGTSDPKIVEEVASELALISGQKAKITRAKKAISNFKLRKGMPIGCCVTLRRYRMYEFLERLIVVAIPRIRDFRGLSSNSFDDRGNYTFGINEQSIFPEINLDKIKRAQGMNITLCTSARTKEEAKALLEFLGFPFRR